jgi:Flp pilus assembly protein CpaB
MDVPVAVRAERPAWVNGKTLIGLLLFCISLVAGQAVLKPPPSARIWSAARSLPAGATLAEGDLIPVAVVLPDDQIVRYLGAGSSIEGRTLDRPVSEGELISSNALGAGIGVGVGRTMAIPITPEHAVGGRLEPGDLVDVYATFDSNNLKARTTLLLSAVEVQDVISAGGAVFDDQTLAGLTVAVSPGDAAKLAFAIRTSELDIVRVDNAASGARSAPVTEDDV